MNGSCYTYTVFEQIDITIKTYREVSRNDKKYIRKRSPSVSLIRDGSLSAKQERLMTGPELRDEERCVTQYPKQTFYINRRIKTTWEILLLLLM